MAQARRPGRVALRLARHWPVLPVLAVAAALRLAGLLPASYYGDEAEYALVAGYLANDWRGLAYPRLEGFAPTPFVSQPPLLLYLDAAAIHATGSVHVGPVLLSALLGAATAGLTYAIGCRLRDRWLGAIAGLFLAVLPFHVSVSRSAQLDAGLTFFVALTMLAFLGWTQRPTWGRAIATGLAASLAVLSKLPGILVLVPIAAVLGAQAVRHAAARRAARRRADAAGAAVSTHALRETGATAGIILTPVVLAGTLYVALLWSLGATRDLLAKLGWQAYRIAGDDGLARPWHWYFTEPTLGLMPQLGTAIALLALVGTVAVARSLRRPGRGRAGRLLLLAWPASILLFFMLSGRKEWFYLMPAMPALAVLAAWPLQPIAREVGAFVARPAATWSPGASMAVLAAAVLLAAALPVHASLADRVAHGGRYGAGLREAAEWIHAQDPDAAQAGTTLGRFSLHLYNGHDTYHYFLNRTFVEQRVADGHLSYVVMDPYLPIGYETAWMEDLVRDHNGTLEHKVVVPGGFVIEVYRLRAA